MKKYRKIPIIKSPQNPSKRININTSKHSTNYNHSLVKLPLARTSQSKFSSMMNLKNESTKQNLTTNYSLMNSQNNNTTSNINNNSLLFFNSKNKNNASHTPRPSHFHSPKNFFDPHKIDYDLINGANDIIKQRKNNKIFLYSLQRNSRKDVLNTIKEISLKNFHINLIRKRRIDIDEKENYINQTLINSSHTLDKNYANFIKIVEILKTEQKKDEEKIVQINSKYESTLSEFNNEININKNLLSNIIKMIKLISNSKMCGSFLYSIFGMSYPFEEIPELDNRIKINEDLSEKVIKVYGNIEKIDTSIFGDDETIMQKFNKFEEKLITILSNKEKLKKEYNNMLKENRNEINILKQKIKMFNEDLEEATFKKKKLLELMVNIFNLDKKEENELENINSMKYVDEDLKACTNYLFEIGDCLEIKGINENKLNINFNSTNELENLKELIDYSKDIIKCLEEKEKLVNEYTDTISIIKTKGTYRDKQILSKLIAKMKRDNKFKNIINIKNKRNELTNVKKLDAIKRQQKFVLRQKKIFIDVPMKTAHNKTEKIKFKENNEYEEYIKYSSEESEENENKNTIKI